VELTRWSQNDKACQKAVGHAKHVFNSAFCELLLHLLSCCAANF